MKKVLLTTLLGLTVSISYAVNNAPETSTTVTVNAVTDSIDEMINSYDKYVDKYIATMKKVKAGDVTAMAEYADLLKQAQDLQKKIEKVKGQMSDAQLAKYQKVVNKLANAMENI